MTNQLKVNVLNERIAEDRATFKSTFQNGTKDNSMYEYRAFIKASIERKENKIKNILAKEEN